MKKPGVHREGGGGSEGKALQVEEVHSREHEKGKGREEERGTSCRVIRNVESVIARSR